MLDKNKNIENKNKSINRIIWHIPVDTKARKKVDEADRVINTFYYRLSEYELANQNFENAKALMLETCKIVLDYDMLPRNFLDKVNEVKDNLLKRK